MATITAKFNAAYPGEHRFGYRTYNDLPNTYTVITVDVVTPGVQSVTFDVVGNLYCADDDITYNCWAVPFCLGGYIDSNNDGVPDKATQWDIVAAQQLDPANRITIENVDVAPVALDLTTICIGDVTTYDELPTTITLAPGDTIEVLADADLIAGLPVTLQATVNTNGHCEPCLSSTVDVPAGTGKGYLIYAQCWDLAGNDAFLTVYRALKPGDSFALGCVIPTSINIIIGTLNVTPTVTSVVCP